MSDASDFNAPAAPAIAELRKEIDGIDDEILRLLNRRAKVVIKIGEAKSRSQGTAFHQPARERAILDRLTAENSGPFPTDALRPVFREILSACLSLEAPLKVAYLGPDSSFTHLAARQRFGLSAVYSPTPTIPAVFDDVSRGRADYGVAPIEDSVEGVVQHTLDSFLDSDLRIVGEVVVEVAHHLLGRASVGEVERVFATPQAVSECRRWLEQQLPRAVLVEVATTAQAAESASADATCAAIGPELAGELHDLRIIKPRIDDQAPNQARLLVLGKTEVPPSGRDRTSLLFTLRDEPGGLFRVLKFFSDAGVNLTKIESRPSRRRAWDYSFFVDLDGHARAPSVAQALTQIAAVCTVVRVLGSYPRAEASEA
jgi:chorismate mutase/prephenate dehydratase